MPVTSDVSTVPQRWIVCALCSCALAYITSKNYCFYQIDNVVDSSTQKPKAVPTGDGCPFLFLDQPWRHLNIPFKLPDFYWVTGSVDLANYAFKAGKFLVLVPAGVLSDIGYSKHVLGGGMFLVAASHLLLPVFVDFGIAEYVVQNFVDGVGEASIYPSIYSLISRWSAPSERSTFTALIVAGMFYGEVLGYAFFKIVYLGFRSWSVGQYTTGIIGFIWVALCAVFLYHSPEDSPFVPHQEVPTTTSNHQSLLVTLHRLQGVPWWTIVTSRYFIFLVLMFCSLDWIVYLNIYGILLSYQQYILRLPIEFSNISTVVLIVAVPSVLMGGLMADWLVRRQLTTKSAVRRTLAFLSVCCSSALVFAASFVGCNVTVFWVLVVTAVYTLGLAVPVIYSAPIDISPRYAGLLMGIMLVVRTSFSILYEEFIGILYSLIPDEYSPAHWRDRFFICALATVAAAAPFLVFGSGETRIRSRTDQRRPSIELQTSDKPINISTSVASN